MANTNGNPNIAEYGKKTQFNGCSAVDANEKSREKARQNREERKLIKDRILERMGESDWDAYIDGIIDRAKESRADAEFLRDTIGQKPIDKVAVTSIDQSVEELNEYFGRQEDPNY